MFQTGKQENPSFTPPPLAALEKPNEKALCERLLLGAEKEALFAVIFLSLWPEPASQALREPLLKRGTAPPLAKVPWCARRHLQYSTSSGTCIDSAVLFSLSLTTEELEEDGFDVHFSNVPVVSPQCQQCKQGVGKEEVEKTPPGEGRT